MDMVPLHLEDDGAVVNTAVSLGWLGKYTWFLRGISNDIFDRKLIANLKEPG